MESISEAKIDGLLSDPDFSAEKFVPISGKPTTPTSFDVTFEVLVDLVEHVLDDGDLGLVDRLEGVVDQLLLPGGQNSSLDAELADGLVEAERGRDGADAADKGTVGGHHNIFSYTMLLFP